MKLVLVINGNGVELAQYRRSWRGWQRQRAVSAPWTEGTADATLGEQLAGALRPHLLAWGIAPGTPVLVAPNTGIGGVLTAPLQAGKPQAEQVDLLLSGRLPHSLAEIAACPRVQGASPHQTLSVAWLPQGWLNELRDALARLGLRLEEIYPLAFLLPAALPKAQSGRRLWLAQSGSQLMLWSLAPAMAADGSAVLDASLPNLPQRLALAAFGLSDGRDGTAAWLTSGLDDTASAAVASVADAPVQPAAWPDLAGQTFSAWLAGEQGWWIAPPREWLIARLSPWLIGAAVLLILGIATMSWQRQRLADETTHLDATADHLRPNHRRLEAKERELLRLRGQMLDAESFRKRTGALDALAAATSILPPDAWITHYHYDKDGSRIDGKGVTTDTLLKPLATTGWLANAPKPAAPTAKPTGAPATVATAQPQATPGAQPPAPQAVQPAGSPATPPTVKPNGRPADKPAGQTTVEAAAAKPAPSQPEFSVEMHERPAPPRRHGR